MNRITILSFIGMAFLVAGAWVPVESRPLDGNGTHWYFLGKVCEVHEFYKVDAGILLAECMLIGGFSVLYFAFYPSVEMATASKDGAAPETPKK